MPIPLGSNRTWSWSLAELVIYLLAMAWLIGFVRKVRQRGDHSTRTGDPSGSQVVHGSGTSAFDMRPVLAAKWISLVWIAWLLYLVIYLIPWPGGAVQLLSPETFSTLSLVSESPELSVQWGLTLSPHDTATFFLKSVAWALLFWLTLVLARTRDRIRWLATTIIVAGLVQAVWGGMEALTTKTGLATGGFVNRNHLAGFLEMSLAVGIGLLIAQLGGSRQQGWRNRLGSFLDLLLSPKAILRLSLVIMVIALVLTRSRMGNVAFFSSLLITGSIALVFSRHATRSMVILVASLIVVDIFLVGAWFGVDRVVERIGQTVEQAEQSPAGIGDERQVVFPQVQSMIGDYPAVGAGPGSFQTVFPRYAGSDLSGFYDHAHNDYLEFAAETGWIGLTILGLLVVMSLVQAVLAQYRRRDPLMRGMSFAAIMGITSLLIHSWVDFNLQIPANAALFTILLALGVVANRFDHWASEDRAS